MDMYDKNNHEQQIESIESNSRFVATRVANFLTRQCFSAGTVFFFIDQQDDRSRDRWHGNYQNTLVQRYRDGSNTFGNDGRNEKTLHSTGCAATSSDCGKKKRMPWFYYISHLVSNAIMWHSLIVQPCIFWRSRWHSGAQPCPHMRQDISHTASHSILHVSAGGVSRSSFRKGEGVALRKMIGSSTPCSLMFAFFLFSLAKVDRNIFERSESPQLSRHGRL